MESQRKDITNKILKGAYQTVCDVILGKSEYNGKSGEYPEYIVKAKKLQLKAKYNELIVDTIIGDDVDKILKLIAYIWYDLLTYKNVGCSKTKSISEALVGRRSETFAVFFHADDDSNFPDMSVLLPHHLSDMKNFDARLIDGYMNIVESNIKKGKNIMLMSQATYLVYRENDVFHLRTSISDIADKQWYRNTILEQDVMEIVKYSMMFHEELMVDHIISYLYSSPTKTIKILSQYLNGIDEIIDLVLKYDMNIVVYCSYD